MLRITSSIVLGILIAATASSAAAGPDGEPVVVATS
jgi:hypothetical protein